MIYFDHNSTTQPHREVVSEILKALEVYWGNASSSHEAGRDARKFIEEARISIASLINCSPEEIVFTGSGTESNNLALIGVALSMRPHGNHIITSEIEHHAVLSCMKFLEDQGFNITFLTPDKNGTINPAVLKSAITKDTILISIMHANNETGIIQPIEEMSSGISGKNINFHTDAIQTVGKIPVNVEKLGVNLLSMSAHKVHGPKGVGALYIKNGTQIKNILFGGGQENGLRPGTYNVPGIAGYGMAARIARTNLDINEGYVDALREKLEYGIKQLSQNAVIPGERGCRLYNTLMVCFPGEDGNSLISSLDLLHIQVSSGAACTSESSELSHVLLSMKIDPELAKGAVRFSLGPSNSEDEVDTVLKALKKLLKCKY